MTTIPAISSYLPGREAFRHVAVFNAQHGSAPGAAAGACWDYAVDAIARPKHDVVYLVTRLYAHTGI